MVLRQGPQIRRNGRKTRRKIMLKRSITAIFIVAAVVGSFLLRQFVDVRLFDILIFAFCAFGSFELLRALNGRLTVFQRKPLFCVRARQRPMYAHMSISAVFAITSPPSCFCFRHARLSEFETSRTLPPSQASSLFALCYPSGLLAPAS